MSSVSNISRGHHSLTEQEITERYNAMIQREKRYDPEFDVAIPRYKRVSDDLLERAKMAGWDVNLQTGECHSSESLQNATSEKAPTKTYAPSFSGKGGRNRRSKLRRSKLRRSKTRRSKTKRSKKF
jgi:hypothetical protein